jgi:hypothetical protein
MLTETGRTYFGESMYPAQQAGDQPYLPFIVIIIIKS